MNPTEPAKRLAEKILALKYSGRSGPQEINAAALLIDAAIQEATKELHTEKDDWQLRCRNAIDHWHREAELLVAERDQLKIENAKLTAKLMLLEKTHEPKATDLPPPPHIETPPII